MAIREVVERPLELMGQLLGTEDAHKRRESGKLKATVPEEEVLGLRYLDYGLYHYF